MGLELGPIKEKATRVLDLFQSNFAGGFFTETYRYNRDRDAFSLEKHFRGGNWGLVIYPDGTVEQAQSRDVLYRKDFHDDRILDRIVAGNAPEGYFFVPQNDYDLYMDELAEAFTPPSRPRFANFNGGGGVPMYSTAVLSEEQHRQLLAKVTSGLTK